MIPLSSQKRSELRAQAHQLTPVVIIGDKGLTDEVMAEIDRSLTAHELIKVRAASAERDARDVWIESICERLAAHPVQQIGKIFVLYRENLEKAAKVKKAAAAAARAARRKPEPELKRTSRPRSRAPSPRPESEPRRRRPRSSR
jgi:RNA-binding protein